MKDDALGGFWRQVQHLTEVPGDRLPFAVFIGCEPDIFFANGFDSFFQFGSNFFLLWINFIDSIKIVLDIDRRRAVLGLFDDGTDMPDARKYLKIFTEIFLDSFGFRGALDDN